MVDRDGYLEPVLLDPVPAPPDAWLQVPGGVLIAVQSPPGVVPYAWHTAVALAWARSPATGALAVLAAWETMRRGPVRAEVAPRWGWYLFDPTRCRGMKAVQVPNAWGLLWWGRRPDSAMTAAVRGAVAALPPHLREQALTPLLPETEWRPPAL